MMKPLFNQRLKTYFFSSPRTFHVGEWAWLFFFCLLSLLTYSFILSYYFTDVDALSLIATGKFSSIRDIFSLWGQELMGGRMPNAQYYRPFLSLFYGWEGLFFGLNPKGYHAMNIFLHGSSAFFTYLLCRKLLPQCPRVFCILGGIFFLWHPLQVENVPAIARQGDLLATTLMLGSLLFYLSFSKKVTHSNKYQKLIYYSGSFIFCVLAIFTKEPAIILIPLILLADFLFAKSPIRITKTLFRTLPFLIFLVFFLKIRTTVLQGAGGYIPAEESRSFLQEYLFRLHYVIVGHFFAFGFSGFSGEFIQKIISLLKIYNFLWVIVYFMLFGGFGYYIYRRINDRVVTFCVLFLMLQGVMVFASFFMFRYLYLSLVPFSILLVREVCYFMDEGKKNKWGKLGGALVICFLSLSFWSSPWFDRHLYRRWQESGQITQQFLSGLAQEINKNSDVKNIFLLSIPYKRLYRSRDYFFWDIPQTQILLEHAIQDFVSLQFPQRSLKMYGLSYIYLLDSVQKIKIRARWINNHSIELHALENVEVIDYPWVKIPGRVTDQKIYDLISEKEKKKAILSLTPKALSLPKTMILHYLGGDQFQTLKKI